MCREIICGHFSALFVVGINERFFFILVISSCPLKNYVMNSTLEEYNAAAASTITTPPIEMKSLQEQIPPENKLPRPK